MTDVLFGGAVVLLAVIVVAALFGTDRRMGGKALQRRLQHISAARSDTFAGLQKPVGGGSFLKVIEESGPYTKLEELVVRANARHTARWYLVLMLGLAALAAVVMAPAQNALGTLIGAFAAGAAPVVFLKFRADKRRREFDEQLPEVLDFMARALKAGHSLTVAFQMVGEEMPAPASEEFRRVFEEINFGFSFQAALRRMPDRIDSPDLSFLVIGLLIQRETGGNLAELLANLGAMGRERLKLRGRVKVLAAEGKFSGILLGFLPFGIGAAMTFMNPDYMSVLWSTDEGLRLVWIGLGMLFVGFVWMSQVVKIKV